MASEEAIPSSPSPRTAPYPFDKSQTGADIILRSSDSVDFYVHKAILSMASPFFSDMFALPAAGDHGDLDEKKDGLTVIDMRGSDGDSEATLAMMLRFSYPRACCPIEPSLDNLDSMKRAIKIVSKYDIDVVRSAIVRRLEEDRDVEAPERIFAVAWQYRADMKDIVMAAARRTLQHLQTPMPEFEELDSVPAMAFVRLQHYQLQVKAVVSYTVYDFSWLQLSDLRPPILTCTLCGAGKRNYASVSGGSTAIACWWTDYINRVIPELEKSPWYQVPTAPHLVAASMVKTSGCTACTAGHGAAVYAAMASFSEHLSEEIKRRVQRVELQLS